MMTSPLSPKEALSETCPECDGMGCGYVGKSVVQCGPCSGTGRRVRTTHEASSGIGQESHIEGLLKVDDRNIAKLRADRAKYKEMVDGVLGALADAATVAVDETWPARSIRALAADRDHWKAKAERYREALEAAAKSLEALARSGARDAAIIDLIDVRGYANGRAVIARAALKEPTK